MDISGKAKQKLLFKKVLIGNNCITGRGSSERTQERHLIYLDERGIPDEHYGRQSKEGCQGRQDESSCFYHD